MGIGQFIQSEDLSSWFMNNTKAPGNQTASPRQRGHVPVIPSSAIANIDIKWK